MIVDTSAIIAMVLGEADAPRIMVALANADQVRMSTGTRLELAAVTARYGRDVSRLAVERILAACQVELVPFDANQLAIAETAYLTYGRGSGHRAALNYGDCFAYALSKATDEPLLYVGNDFRATDIRAAL